MSADATAVSAASAVLRGQATWYSWLLTGFYLYSVNLQGNVVPFLQLEFALSYRAVSLHSSAIAAGMILVGFVGDRQAIAACVFGLPARSPRRRSRSRPRAPRPAGADHPHLCHLLHRRGFAEASRARGRPVAAQGARWIEGLRS